MPTVTFFNAFSKRLNSTKQPSLSTGTDYTCVFRDGYDVLNPSVILDLRDVSGYENPSGYTYAYISDFSRYYWVSGWSFEGGLWYCQLNADVLASHKTAIGTTNIYATRLADRLLSGSVHDGGLTDTMIPTLAQPTISRTRYTSPFQSTLTSGCYIIGVVNEDQYAAGSISYYVMTPAEFKIFRNRLMGGAWVQSTAEMSVDTTKAILNPIQYLTSCMWFPLTSAQVADPNIVYYGMSLGWWPISDANTTPQVTYKTITSSAMYRTHTNITLPVHPDYAATTQKMLKCGPFSEFILTVPFFGSIPVSGEDFTSGTIGVSYEVDLISGKASMQLYNGSISSDSGYPDLALVYQTSCLIATPIQLSQVTSDSWASQVVETQTNAQLETEWGMWRKKLISGLGQTAKVGIGGLLGTAGLGDAVDLITEAGSLAIDKQILDASMAATSESGLYSSFSAKAPRVTSLGANGSTLGAWCPLEIRAVFLRLSTTDSNVYARTGYAAGWYTQINQHTGYVQGLLGDFHDARCYKSELMAINQYIMDGFYYE